VVESLISSGIEDFWANKFKGTFSWRRVNSR